MRLLIVAICLLCLLATVPVTAASLTITADNVYWAWLNPTLGSGFATYTDTVYGGHSWTVADRTGFIGTNWPLGQSGPPDWATPRNFGVPLSPGTNELLIRAANYLNASEWPSNPAGVLAKLTSGSSVLSVTNGATWMWCLNAKDNSPDGVWREVVDQGALGVTPWGSPDSLSGLAGADWIWSENTLATGYPYNNPRGNSDIWLRTTVTVPEPFSIMLGAMGLGSIAAFRRLKRRTS